MVLSSRRLTCRGPTRISFATSSRNCNAAVCFTKTTPARPCAKILACRARPPVHGKVSRAWRPNNKKGSTHALAQIYGGQTNLVGDRRRRPRNRGQRRSLRRVAAHTARACLGGGENRTAADAAYVLLRRPQLSQASQGSRRQARRSAQRSRSARDRLSRAERADRA